MEKDKGTDIGLIMDKACTAAAVYSQFSQARTDRIVRAVYEAAFAERVRLAKMAEEETGIGNWRDKVMKNVIATQFVYESIRDEKTVGVISDDRERGITEIAQPLGPLFAIVPVTNPTSTVLFKILIALKTRNPIILHPHRRASRCSMEAARICYEAAIGADAPEYCIQVTHDLSHEETRAIMGHPRLALVLATGGPNLVHAAYSSGTPAIGVGAGNVPVLVERTADPVFAAEQILTSKTFDNGTVCASEQSVVAERPIAEAFEAAFRERGAHFLNPDEVKRLETEVYDREHRVMRIEAIGRHATVLAERAAIPVPEGTRLLVAPLEGVGEKHPLSAEILAPVIAYYTAPDFDQAVNLCLDLNFFGGQGHTVSIFSNDEGRIHEYAELMNAGRIVVNQPSSQGGVGGLFNHLAPSLTLGCGTGGKNITTDNISARHLLNVCRIARRRVNERLAQFDKALYLDESIDAAAAERLYNRNR